MNELVINNMQKKKPAAETKEEPKTALATPTQEAGGSGTTPAAPKKEEQQPATKEGGSAPEEKQQEQAEKKEGDPYSTAASELATGDALNSTINQIMEMGFPKEDVIRAMKAAYNNPDRAVEYLMTGIPEAMAVEPSAPQPEAQGNQQAAQQQQQQDQPFNMFASSGRGQQQQSSGPLAALRNNPQFQTLRALVQQSPELLQPMLQELGKSSPELLSTINENQEEFLAMINEPLGPGEQQLAEFMTQMAAAQEGEPGSQVLEVELTEEEAAAVDRLVALGFEKEACIEAFLICDKNEEAAANYLLENS